MIYLTRSPAPRRISKARSHSATMARTFERQAQLALPALGCINVPGLVASQWQLSPDCFSSSLKIGISFLTGSIWRLPRVMRDSM